MADPRPDDDNDDDEDKDDGAGIDGAEWLRRAGVPAPDDTPRRGSWALTAAPLLAAVACAVVGGLVVGSSGVAAGLVAGVLVLAFLASGAIPLTLSQGLGDPAGLGLLLLLVNYAFRLVAALVVVVLLVRLGWIDREVTGVSVIVCALARVNTQMLLLLGWRRDAPGTG